MKKKSHDNCDCCEEMADVTTYDEGTPQQHDLCFFCEGLSTDNEQRGDLARLGRLIVRAMSMGPAKRKKL